jgi:outer membrane protein assembly factor BamB
MNTQVISERTPNGTGVIQRNVGQQPLNVDLIPGGGIVIVCRGQVVEWDKDGKLLNAFARQNFDIVTGHRLPNGDVLFLTSAFQGANCIRLDGKLKDTGKNYTFGRVQNPQAMDVIGDEKVLVCEFNKVAEYDLKTGKQTWKYDCNAPTSCQRLPNGNTLISLVNQNQAIEVDPSGEIVWEYQAKDGLRVGRTYRR